MKIHFAKRITSRTQSTNTIGQPTLMGPKWVPTLINFPKWMDFINYSIILIIHWLYPNQTLVEP